MYFQPDVATLHQRINMTDQDADTVPPHHMIQSEDRKHYPQIMNLTLGVSEPNPADPAHQQQLNRLYRLGSKMQMLNQNHLDDQEAERMLGFLKNPLEAPAHAAKMVDEILEKSPQHSSGSTDQQGDLPPFNHSASGHITGHGTGSLLNTVEQDGIASTLRDNGANLPPSIESVISTLDQIGAYNQGQPPEKKVAGAYLALNTLSKMATLPPAQLKGENEASAAYGALKVAGAQGDGAMIREILEEKGGSAMGLSDKDLVDLWGVNEHHHLHAVLFGNSKVYNPIHMTSLNDQDQWGEIPGEKGALGGFNDKGEYPQWGWFDDAQGFQSLFEGTKMGEETEGAPSPVEASRVPIQNQQVPTEEQPKEALTTQAQAGAPLAQEQEAPVEAAPTTPAPSTAASGDTSTVSTSSPTTSTGEIYTGRSDLGVGAFEVGGETFGHAYWASGTGFMNDPAQHADLKGYVEAAAAQGKTATVVAYGLGDINGGNAGEVQDYGAYIQTLSKAIGDNNVEVYLEPDLAGLHPQMMESQEMLGAIAYLQANNPNAQILVDTTHSNWKTDLSEYIPAYEKMVQAGVDGFVGNVSNYRPNPELAQWMHRELYSRFGDDMTYVVDTSRNGASPIPSGVENGEWADVPGAGIGEKTGGSMEYQGMTLNFRHIKPATEADVTPYPGAPVSDERLQELYDNSIYG